VASLVFAAAIVVFIIVAFVFGMKYGR